MKMDRWMDGQIDRWMNDRERESRRSRISKIRRKRRVTENGIKIDKISKNNCKALDQIGFKVRTMRQNKQKDKEVKRGRENIINLHASLSDNIFTHKIM